MILNETVFGKPIIEEISRENLPDGVLCRVSYPICDVGKKNANGRVYEDAVWEKVREDADLKDKLDNRALFGHAEHPEQTQSNLEKTSHVIFEMWNKDGQEWQKFDVLDTPTGRIVDCLLRADCRVGCSTRAEGDLEEAEDDEGTFQRVVPESYKYVTTDFTADPSTTGAIPHDIKRNIVTEVKKIFETKDVDKGEQEFAEKVLESMQCKKSKDHECQNCGCCKVLDERKLSVKENEKKTIADLLKEGIIKEGAEVTYVDKVDDGASLTTLAKVGKIEEGKVTLLLGDMDPTTVAVDGNASVSVSPEGLVTILSAEAMEAMCPPDLGQEVAPVEDAPVDDTPADDMSVEDEIPVEDELGEATKDTDDEIEKISPEDYKYTTTSIVPEKPKHTWKDSEKKSKPDKKYTEEEQLARRKADHDAILHGGNESLKVGDTFKIAEGDHKDKEGKITKIEETGITVSLDDGTTVSIEDPTAVNITVTSPVPEEEIKIVPEEPIDEPVEEEPIAPEEPVEEPLSDEEIPESKVNESYGAAYIEADLSRGLSKEKIIQKLQKRYPNIDDKYAEEIVTAISKGEDWPTQGPPEDDEEIAALARKESKTDEARVDTEGGVSDKLADGNLLKDKDGTHWIVSELTDTNLLITQPGEAGTEKSIGWDEVPSFGFTKLAEKIEECVCHIYDMDDNKLLEFYKNVMLDPNSYTHSEAAKQQYPVDKLETETEITKRNLEIPIIAERELEKSSKAVVVREKDGGWGVFITGDGKDRLLTRFDEKDDATKHAEKYAGDKGVNYKGIEEFKLISTTVKEIKNLKIQEASTRVERDKAVELLEELTDEKQQFETKVIKDKTLEIKMLVKRIGKTLEAKEREVDALRSKLEEKAKLAVEQKKLVSETRVNSLKGITDLTESVAIEAKITKDDWAKSDEKHAKELDQLSEASKLEEKQHKEACEVLQEKVKKEVTEKVTKQFIKSFVEFRLSETNLKVDENSRALLEQSTSLEDVDNLLDEIVDASRRSALHSEAIRGIRVPKHVIPDPEGDRIKRSVDSVYEGMNG